MKKMRRFAGLLLAMVMVMSMAVSVFADETTYSITINNNATGHTYEAYQIFTGDISKEANPDAVANTNAVLSNIKWGNGVTYKGEGVVVATADDGTQTYSKEAKDIAAALASGSLTPNAFIADLTLTTTVAANVSVAKDAENFNGKYVLNGLKAGYYLVKDKDNTVGGNDSYTEYILEVVENSELNPKSDVPEVVKKVDDKNDSNTTEDETVWQDSADYDIGDDVPFKLEATLANNVESYDWYKIVFHDTLSAGLTYNGDAKVYFGKTEVTNSFTITPGNGTLTISCNDVKAFGATNNSVITVLYTAKLNDGAVIGSAGNPNTVKLQFSNNPNWKPEGDETPTTPPNNPPTGETPEDKVIVFTYKVIVNKVDQNKKPLAGAEFTLYKYKKVVEDDPETEENETKYDYVAIGSKVVGTTPTGSDIANLFTWKGLDDGDYKLVETTTPVGYNTIADILFTISATHSEKADEPILITLTGGDKFTGEVDAQQKPTGTLTTDVENKSGTVLPETGGMGTTLFYVIGATLAIGAAVVMVTRKRMSAN